MTIFSVVMHPFGAPVWMWLSVRMPREEKKDIYPKLSKYSNNNSHVIKLHFVN